jgi:hypothetical protein
MWTRLHALAGGLGLALIAIFWTATVASELCGSPAAIAVVKTAILWGLVLLIPAMAAVGASGFRLARGRGGAIVRRKRRRMPVIALNGLVILVPCAVFLADRAAAGMFDAAFFAVQGVELAAGAANIALMGQNLRDGRRLARGPVPA